MKKLLVSFLLMSSSFIFLTPNVYAEVKTDNVETNKKISPEKKEIKEEIKEIKIVKRKEIKKNNDEDEDDYNPEKNYKGWGVSLGYLSASGLSYRTFFADNWGLKASGAAYMQNAKGFGTFGMQGMYVHSENKVVRFYSLFGASYYGANNGPSIYPTTPGNNEMPKDPPFEHSLGLGGGIGIEIGRKESGISMALEFPVTFIFKNFNKLESIFPIPQISFMYNF